MLASRSSYFALALSSHDFHVSCNRNHTQFVCNTDSRYHLESGSNV